MPRSDDLSAALRLAQRRCFTPLTKCRFRRGQSRSEPKAPGRLLSCSCGSQERLGWSLENIRGHLRTHGKCSPSPSARLFPSKTGTHLVRTLVCAGAVSHRHSLNGPPEPSTTASPRRVLRPSIQVFRWTSCGSWKIGRRTFRAPTWTVWHQKKNGGSRRCHLCTATKKRSTWLVRSQTRKKTPTSWAGMSKKC